VQSVGSEPEPAEPEPVKPEPTEPEPTDNTETDNTGNDDTGTDNNGNGNTEPEPDTTGTVSGITISFVAIADQHITLPEIVLHKSAAKGKTAETVTLEQPAGLTFNLIWWSVDGQVLVEENSLSVILNATDYNLGQYQLSAGFTCNDVPYSKTMLFTVAE
jgi:hypothetical protein